MQVYGIINDFLLISFDVKEVRKQDGTCTQRFEEGDVIPSTCLLRIPYDQTSLGSVIPVFKSAAEDLLNTSGLSPVELLAKALAKSIGYIQIKQRSLLTSMENYVTLLLDPGRPIYSPSFAYGVLRRFLPEEKVESVRGLALTIDKRCAVFDVAADDLDTFLAGNGGEVRLVVVNALPQLQEREQQSRGRYADNARGNGYDNRKGGGGRGNSNAVGFSRGGRTGFSDRRNDRFSRGPASGSRGRGAYRKW